MRSKSIAVLVAAASMFAALYAQQPKNGTTIPDADWPRYNRDPRSSRYSPLKQINASNVAQLKEAWSYRPPAPPPPPDGAKAKAKGKGGAGGIGAEVVPIVVNGVMYVPAGASVIALAADSGHEIWRYQLTRGAASSRGVAYWPGDAQNPPRIIFTSGRNLVAVNANTGKLDPGFGKEGMAPMGVGYNGVPTISKNVVAVGASVLETPQDPDAIGDTHAFDARTGAPLWTFHTVPHPGEVGHETWLDDGWKDRSGVNVWAWQMTVDEERGILYMPLGAPASNYYGGDRPGANLFGNSIVAVDAETGKLKWYFQTVHHDLWDFDSPPAPVLLDITQNGRRIPAIAQVGKSGWMFILNRETGQPIFGVVERPVPKGDVPGEWYSPTQPFPTKPGPLARMSFKKEDMVTAEDTTPEHAKACQELWDRSGGFYNAGPFTPFLLHEDGTPPKSSLIFPGATGGTNWGGMAADPQLGYVFAYSQDQAQVGWTEKKKPGVTYAFDEAKSNLPYTRASVDGPGPFHTFSANAGQGLGELPCQKPPWGRMNAVNANTGEIAWQVTLGVTDGLPEGKRNTGRAGAFAGPTATAGGLVFMAGTSDNRLRALDSRTGKELWVTKLDATATTQAMTFQGKAVEGKPGKQYVAISVGGAVHAFALP